MRLEQIATTNPLLCFVGPESSIRLIQNIRLINVINDFSDIKGPPTGPKLSGAIASLRPSEVDLLALRRAEVLFSNPPAARGAGGGRRSRSVI